MTRLTLTLAAVLLAGCQAAAVQPDAVSAPVSPYPAVDEVRVIANANGEPVAACWRVEGPVADGQWRALCAPVAALVPCIETETNVQCMGAQRQLMGASL